MAVCLHVRCPASSATILSEPLLTWGLLLYNVRVWLRHFIIHIIYFLLTLIIDALGKGRIRSFCIFPNTGRYFILFFEKYWFSKSVFEPYLGDTIMINFLCLCIYELQQWSSSALFWLTLCSVIFFPLFYLHFIWKTVRSRAIFWMLVDCPDACSSQGLGQTDVRRPEPKYLCHNLLSPGVGVKCIRRRGAETLTMYSVGGGGIPSNVFKYWLCL